MPAALATFEVFAAGASASYRPAADSQDWLLTGQLKPQGSAYAVVCDGVGTLPASRAVASEAASATEAWLRDAGVHHVGRAIVSAASTAFTDDGATTVLVAAADAEGRGHFAIAGNGSLLAIDAIPSTSGRRLQMASLVTPHVSVTNGRMTLRSFLPMPNGRLPEVTSGTIAPRPGTTWLLLACSDGVASDDERVVGHLDGGRWLEIPNALTAVDRALATAWPAMESVDDPGPALEAALDGALRDLADGGHLDDDATVGAVLIRAAPDR